MPPKPGYHFWTICQWVCHCLSRNTVSKMQSCTSEVTWLAQSTQDSETIIFQDLNSPFLLMPSKITLVLGWPDHSVGSQETCGQLKPTALFHTSSSQFNPFLFFTCASDVLCCNRVFNSDIRLDIYFCYISSNRPQLTDIIYYDLVSLLQYATYIAIIYLIYS